MRIVLIGESPNLPSGFGMQMGMLARGFRDRGHQVYILANNPPTFEEDDLVCWHIRELDKVAVIDRELEKIRPDCVIVFYHTQQCLDMSALKFAPRNIPVLFWLPWEGSELPWNGRDYFLEVPKDRVIHLSEYAQTMWEKQAPSDWVIPHMLDPEKFKLNVEVDKHALRRKWAKKLHVPLHDDTFLVLNCDRNIWHKRWDATFDYIRQLKKAWPDKDVHLIAHTIMHQKGPSGQDGYDLSKVARMYDVREDVTFTGFDWSRGLEHEEVGELMQMSDVRLTTSQGEGFGVPTIEAAALGVLQILNNTTTMPELMGSEHCPMLINPAFKEERLGTLWQVPDVNQMVATTQWFFEDPERIKTATEKAQRHVTDTFSIDPVMDLWEKAVTEICAANPPETCWLESRWGYKPAMHFKASMEILPEVLKRLEDDPKILEVGSFSGELVKACSEHGLDITGLEPNAKAIEKAGMLAKLNLREQDLLDTWPKADILILTGVRDLIYAEADAAGTGQSFVDEFQARLGEYKWILLWNEPSGDWNIPVQSAEDFTTLVNQTHTRRHDLEELIRERIHGGMLHEVWQLGHDASHIPQGILDTDG